MPDSDKDKGKFAWPAKGMDPLIRVQENLVINVDSIADAEFDPKATTTAIGPDGLAVVQPRLMIRYRGPGGMGLVYRELLGDEATNLWFYLNGQAPPEPEPEPEPTPEPEPPPTPKTPSPTTHPTTTPKPTTATHK